MHLSEKSPSPVRSPATAALGGSRQIFIGSARRSAARVDRGTPSRAITTEVAGHTHRDELRTCRRPLSALFAAATAYIAPLRPKAHRIIKGNSHRHISSSWPAGRSLITTSALASRNAAAHRAAFSRKKSSRVPATRYVCGNRLGIASGGR